MILERLVLENFRQFKDRQEIVFSDLRERNVTIVHAENGFGKTTILKALLWGLYGHQGLKEDFEKPNNIIHEGLAHRAKDPDELKAVVQISFEHDKEHYILTRELTLAQQNLDSTQTSLSLEQRKGGQTYRVDNAQKRIQAIVPDGISSFLFFNGERINYLAEERSRNKVTEAIHQMLGLKLLRTTIDDLCHNNVRGRFRRELKEVASDEKKELIDRQTEVEKELEKLEENKIICQSNLTATLSEIDKTDAKLAANREAMELQATRVRLDKECIELTERRDEIQKRLAKLIADDGYTLFSSGLITRGREIIGRLRGEGKIPAKVLNTFLQELLENGTCICKRHLGEGTPERTAVEGLLTIAGDQDFNNAVGALDHAIGLMEGVANTTMAQLKQLNAERLEINREIKEREETIEEIHQKIGGKNDEEVQKLEESRKQYILKRDELHSSIGRLSGQIDDKKKILETLNEQIKQLADKEETAARAQRRADAVDQCAEILENILKAETEDLRPLLNKEIDTHFRKIIDRDYWAELTDDYTLRIRKRVLGQEDNGKSIEIDAALSTGQRTVTSLVFIASLVALSQRRSEIPTILRGVSGSAYPVAIDSPFGSLSIFREGVARYIPELSPQVLLLVSPEQYKGQVEEALAKSGRIGKRYYLSYHGPALPERAAPKLFIQGQEIQQYFQSTNDEFTKIESL
ncbi:MAG TPA: AAA family ATPase [Candidatus Ozemobacteraceae bacterium]|nr:AAA family ATPase [Candidatus Ozemobacteraceae bacterium]